MQNKLVVIFGASGSGKTTLANEILQYFSSDKAVIISQDDYYHGSGVSTVKNFDEPSALDFSLLESNLRSLVSNKEIKGPIYNFRTHLRENYINNVKPKSIVILDGTMIMTNKVIGDLSSYNIYCDIDNDVCFIRRLNRDIKERGGSVDSIILQYLEDVKPSFFKYIKKFKDKAVFHYNEANKTELFRKLEELL